MNNPRQLKGRFAYQFAGPNIGISIAKGWFPAFARLCHQIDDLLGADKRNFHWTQVKEKFGSARYYWAMDRGNPSIALSIIGPDGSVLSRVHHESLDETDPQSQLSSHISKLISAASSATGDVCNHCGAPGKLDSSSSYILVLCEEHARARRRNALPDWWFSEDES